MKWASEAPTSPRERYGGAYFTPIGTRLSYFASLPVLAGSCVGWLTVLALCVPAAAVATVLLHWNAVQMCGLTLQLAGGAILADLVLKHSARGILRLTSR